MKYSIEWKISALREYKKLSGEVQGAVKQQVDSLADTPRPHGCRKLAGFERMYRIRVGDYRVVYEIQDAVLLVFIVRVRLRSESYRGL